MPDEKKHDDRPLYIAPQAMQLDGPGKGKGYTVCEGSGSGAGGCTDFGNSATAGCASGSDGTPP